MQYTDNYSLRLPQGGEKVKREDINHNTNAVDGIMADNRKISLRMYDENSTYDAGEIRGHESSGRIKAYKCNTDNTTGVWDSTKWDETDLATEIELAASSGGTTVVANPTGTATDTLNTVQIGNEIFDIEGGGSGSGAYIDTDNVIQSLTLIPANTDISYTATQNCCVVFALISASNNSAKAEVDGVKIHEQFASSQTLQFSSKCILKKGQTIVFRQSYTQNNGNYIVYGITYTSPNLQPTVYSEEEREVGVWTDGKPLYEKTVINTSDKTLTARNWTVIDTSPWISSIETIVSATMKRNQDCAECAAEFNLYNGTIRVVVPDTDTFSAGGSYTIRYTKTTDTPGSGTWTPQGVPAIHYSTDEKVVGTWIDGSTLYERTLYVENPTKGGPSNGKYYYSTIGATGIDVAFIVSSCIYDSTYSRWYGLPYSRIWDTENIYDQVTIMDNEFHYDVIFNSSQSYNITKIAVTYRYTKVSS